MSAESNPVTDLFETYSSAVRAKDIEAFLALYSPETIIFDTWGHWQQVGLDAWRPMVSMWFESLGDNLCDTRFTDVVTTVRDDIAFAHAAVQYAAVTTEGAQVDSMMNRLTVTLAKNDGVWKITHEHTSLPLDMQSGNGLFDAYEQVPAR